MKQVIRALGWATTVLWILVIAFSGTVVYSAVQMGIEPGEPQEPFVSNGTVITSVPFTINNMGFYDISNFEITTHITDKNGTAISSSTTPPSLIPKSSKVTILHNISISLNEITANTLTYMLTNDTVLNIDMLVALIYAHAIPLNVSLSTTMPWGAPLYNLTVSGSIVPPDQVNVSLSFENHAFFSLDGSINLEIVYRFSNWTDSETTPISVQPGGSYGPPIPVTITGNPSDVKEVRLYFNTSLFSFGPVVITV